MGDALTGYILFSASINEQRKHREKERERKKKKGSMKERKEEREVTEWNFYRYRIWNKIIGTLYMNLVVEDILRRTTGCCAN